MEIKKSFRGYNCREVDEYITKLAEMLKVVNAKNIKLQEEEIRLKDEISNTLVAAQKTAKEIINQAKREAALEIERQQDTMTHMRTQLLEARKRIDGILEKTKAE